VTLVDYLGWTATAVFVSSYFSSGATTLRRMQMAGSILWMAYGTIMHAAPVVAANLLVLAAAAWTGRRPATADDRSIQRLDADVPVVHRAVGVVGLQRDRPGT
jgi:hypothetical protein